MPLMRALYSLALWLAQPLLKRKLKRRAIREPGYGHAIEQRFGHYEQAPERQANRLIWVHAVSLGETRAAAMAKAEALALRALAERLEAGEAAP